MRSRKRPNSENVLRRYLSGTEAAKLFKVSPATITAWLDEGMPGERRGKQGAQVELDIQKIAPWIAGRRATRPDSARVNVAAEQAEKLRIENAARRGEYVREDEMRRQINEACAGLVQVLDAMPQRVSSDAETQNKVAVECRAARDAFAGKLEHIAEKVGALEVRTGDSPRAAGTNGRAMG